MLEIKNFSYNGKDRQLLVLKEDASTISGIDLNILELDVRVSLKGQLTMNGWTGEAVEDEKVANQILENTKIRDLMLANSFRKFSKNSIENFSKQ